MASVDPSRLQNAIKKRKDHVLDNLDTLTMKQFRALLEEDMGLPEKSLREHKEAIEEMVDQLVTSHKTAETKKVKESSQKPKTKPKAKSDTKKEQREQPAAKRQKKKSEDVKPVPATKQHGKAVEKMKKVCKQAGIKVPPNIYRVKPGTTLEEAFDALLDKYDLTQHSSSVDIGAAAKKLQKERDLEGIDTSNIVEGGRRSRGRVNYSAVLKSQVGSSSESENEQNEDGDSKGSSSSSSEPDSEVENVSPVSRPAKRKAQKSSKAESSDEEEEGDEDSESASEAGSDDSIDSIEAAPKAAGKAKTEETHRDKTANTTSGKGKVAKVKAELLQSRETKTAKGLDSSGKARQPLQESNAELHIKTEVKAEPGTSLKSSDSSGRPKRSLATWSDDDD